MTAPGTAAAAAAAPAAAEDSELQMAQPKPKAFKLPEKFPDQPWKKQTKITAPPSSQTPPSTTP
jgi:hypothetical protein